VSVTERFYETLFEVSNDYRHSILLLLKEKPMKIVEISKKLDLTSQEVSRHLSRLSESELVIKDVEGQYHLTNYAKLVHVLLEEFEFISKHRDYFVDHSVLDIDTEFIKRLGDLSSSRYVSNTMEFLHFVDKLIKDSKKFVWLQVDQYPLTSIGSIIDGLRRGVRFRVLEQSELLSGPRVNLDTIEEAETIIKTRNSVLSEQRTLNENGVFMFLSENRCAVAFPTKGANFDYKGFTANDKRSVKWCSDLFNNYWDKVESRQTQLREIGDHKPTPLSVRMENGVAIIDGQNSSMDPKNVQYAVDNYDDILLRGTFDFDASTIKVPRSVKIRGERGEDSPSTKIYKRGWVFPLVNFDSVFEVNGKNIDVVIENIHFKDFDCSCIDGRRARSLKILNNRMTLETAYGRGWKYHQFGDFVTGVWLDSSLDLSPSEKNFAAGILIEGNYLDFEEGKVETSPERYTQVTSDVSQKQDEAVEHQYYSGMGIHVNNLTCKVDVRRNIIRNMNARGISVTDNFSEAKIAIADNVIHSEVPGSYPFHGVEAGSGIFAEASFLHKRPGFSIDIQGNSIRVEKPDYCGIEVFRSEKDDEDIGEFFIGSVLNNQIYLKDGLFGIYISPKNVKVSDNVISGNAFYGIQTKGFKKSSDLGLKLKDNNLTELIIRDPVLHIRRRKPVK
jgi:predicted transcriptional regulator